MGKVCYHTCHCVQKDDEAADVFVCGGVDWDRAYRPIAIAFRLGDIKGIVRSTYFIFILCRYYQRVIYEKSTRNSLVKTG